MNPLEIFKPGVHVATDGRRYEFTEADCREFVESYDPTVYQSPLVKGHPKADEPRFGSVKRLELSAGNIVRAESERIDPDFAEEVKSGKFPYLSASLYTRKSPANPKPGKLYLRHVGFLGAVPPAIKGMKQTIASFADSSEEAITVAFAEIKVNKGESGEITLEFAEIQHKEDPMDPVATALASKQAELDKQKAELDKKTVSFSERENSLNQREADIAKKEREQKRQANLDFVEGKIKEARIPLEAKLGLVDFMCHLDDQEAIEFSEPGKEARKETPLAFFKSFIGSLMPSVEFGERLLDEEEKLPDTADPKVIAQAATKFRNEQRNSGIDISFAEAVEHVVKGGK